MWRIFIPVSFVLSSCPRVMDVYISRFLAWVCFDVLAFRKKVVLANLNTVFKEQKTAKELDQIARKSYENFFFIIFDFFRSYYPKHNPLGVTFKGDEYLQKLLASPEASGLYMACAHTGNWELMGAEVSNRYIPSHVIVKRVGPPIIDKFVEVVRKNRGVYILERKKKGDAFKNMIKVMRRGEILGVVCDQYKPGGVDSYFFGEMTKTNPALAVIWEKIPRPIIPVRCYRDTLYSCIIEFSEPLEFVNTGHKEKDILTNIDIMNRCLEKQIIASPENYFWFHKRWKV